jgi:hypothetical protein
MLISVCECALIFLVLLNQMGLEMCRFSSVTCIMVCGSPLDLCDRLAANGEVPPPSFTMQASPHGNGPGLLSGGLPPGSSVRPPSAGMPLGLPGSNGMPPGTPAVSSSATMNAAAARWLCLAFLLSFMVDSLVMKGFLVAFSSI